MTLKSPPSVREILWPLALGLLFFTALTIGAAFWVQERNIETQCYMSLDRVGKAYHNLITEHAGILASHLDSLEENPTLRQVFVNEDWNRLSNLAGPLVEKLGHRHQITHLYFISLDKTIILRAHLPHETGDKAEFAILKSAVLKKDFVWGIEIGKFGNLALRVVKPWRIGGLIKGYIMLGSNLGPILDLLKTSLGMEALLLIDKNQLNIDNWQKGHIKKAKNAEWDVLPAQLLAHATLKVDQQLFSQLKNLPSAPKEGIFPLYTKGKTYKASIIDLTDFSGKPVAQLIPLLDFAPLQKNNRKILYLLAITLCCLAAALFAFLQARVKGHDRLLKKTGQDLSREIKERGRAESQLMAHRDRLSVAVEERTRDLHLSNQKLKAQIIEKKHALEALQQSEARYRSIVENSHVGIGIIDDNYRVVYANDMTCRIFGRRARELFGMDLRHIIGSKEVVDRYQSRQQGFEEPNQYQIKIIRPNGEQREIEVIVSLIQGPGGKNWTITQMLDITDRQKVEKELRLSEEKHRNILSSIDEGYFELNLDGKIIFCNDSLARQLNIPKEQLIERRFQEFVDEKTSEIFGILSKDPGNFHQPVIISECEVKKKSEETKIFEISGSIIWDESEVPQGIRGVARDVTQRVKGQREKHKQQAQLNQARKMEAVGALASGVAHDFNNVLQAISAYVELLQTSHDLQSESKDTLAKMDQVIERAAQLVRHLLSFGREDEVETQRLDLNRIILQVADILRHTLPKMIEIETDLSQTPPIIQGEPSRLEQVLMNLGINAKDAMPEGGTLSFSTSLASLDETHQALNPKARPGDHIKLTVSDTGTGMDEMTKEHLFEPFFTTKKPGQGTGLGMATVYGIVNSLNGHIVFESALGKGTTFDIYFPVKKQKQADIPMKTPTPNMQATLSANETTILLVDDEEIILEVAKSLLKDFGYLVHTASNGEAALELIQKDPTAFDAIILDLNMPGIGGHKTLTEILKINPQAKVLIASGYASAEMTRQNLEAGAKAFLNKPFRMKTLTEKLRQVLAQ